MLSDLWRQTIDTWKLGGQLGVSLALSKLEAFGFTPAEAKHQLAGAINLYREELHVGVPNGRDDPGETAQKSLPGMDRGDQTRGRTPHTYGDRHPAPRKVQAHRPRRKRAGRP